MELGVPGSALLALHQLQQIPVDPHNAPGKPAAPQQHLRPLHPVQDSV